MKTQICLLFIVVMLTSSCVAFRHANYVKNTPELPQKLPKLALDVDTSSIAAVFNQFEYLYGRYPIVYGYRYDGPFKTNDDYLNIPETYITVYLPSTPDQFKDVFYNISSPKILNVITHKVYSMPDISKKGVMKWGSNFSGSKLDTIALYNSEKEFLSTNPNFVNKKVAIESSWANYLFDGPREMPLSKLGKPFKTSTPSYFHSYISENNTLSIQATNAKRPVFGDDYLTRAQALDVSKLKMNAMSTSNQPYGDKQWTIGSEICSKALVNPSIVMENKFSGIYDLRIADQLAYLKSIVDSKICEQDSELQGKIKFEVLKSELSSSWFWLIPSSLTLLTINLLGFPMVSQGVNLTMKCSILDLKNNVVYSKVVSGKGTSYIALYWGYGGAGGVHVHSQGGVTRSSYMKAVSSATKLIIQDIALNTNEIMNRLE